MSDTILKLIPIKPDFIPAKEKQEQASLFINSIFKGDQIETILNEDVEFVDQGSGFESVSCNYCGANINMEVWQEGMNKAYETQFTDLTFITPCCSKTTSLNDLLYYQPAGFAKFIVSISNPKENILTDDLDELQKILGTELKIVWAHY